jgi:photosynthetic reaction center cytochrome c subunit
MARDVNVRFMTPLEDYFPPHRKGPEGDVFKQHCTTCHQGVNKPLYGADMISQYPSLAAPGDQPWPPEQGLGRGEDAGTVDPNNMAETEQQ